MLHFKKINLLSKNLKAWIISVSEEILYVGWALIRNLLILALSSCKEIHYKTLPDLLETACLIYFLCIP